MKVTNNFNSTNFKGIKLSSNKFEDVKDVAMHLQFTGFDNLGHRTIYANNTFDGKSKAINKIRREEGLYDREFGAIFFPWSKEAYIIAKPEYEQLMLPVVQHIDPNAKLNLLM